MVFYLEAFRLRLLEMIDNLLDILEEDNDFYAFMLMVILFYWKIIWK